MYPLEGRRSTIRLMLGDCLERMKEIDDGSVDAVIADPPYGTTACKWDSVIPLEPMWSQLKRVIKPNGAIVLFGSQPFTSVLVMSNLSNFRHEWVWDKVNKYTGALQANKRRMRRHEDICVFSLKANITYNKQWRPGEPYSVKRTKGHGKHVGDAEYDKVRIGENNGNHNPCSILQIPADNKRELGLHPTQKPVALMEYLIRTYTNEDETVLDFTMGSGTTGVACVKTKRNFIGIELDDGYFKIAEQRIMETEPPIF